MRPGVWPLLISSVYTTIRCCHLSKSIVLDLRLPPDIYFPLPQSCTIILLYPYLLPKSSRQWKSFPTPHIVSLFYTFSSNVSPSFPQSVVKFLWVGDPIHENPGPLLKPFSYCLGGICFPDLSSCQTVWFPNWF